MMEGVGEEEDLSVYRKRPNLFPHLTLNEFCTIIHARASALANNCPPLVPVKPPSTPEEVPSWEMKVALLELKTGKLNNMISERSGQPVLVGKLKLRRDY